MSDADAERLRIDDQAAEDDATHETPYGPTGALAVLARTYNDGTYPTGSKKFVAVEALGLLGDETEGAVGVTAGTGMLFKAYAARVIPPVGTDVICYWVPYRWVFEYDV